MAGKRDYSIEVDYDSEHTLREMHQLLSAIHSHALAMIGACERFRFDVVDPDKYFNRITQGGMLTDIEKTARGLRNTADWGHVNVRCELDALDWPVHPHDREDGPWARAREQWKARMKFYRDRGIAVDENGDPLPEKEAGEDA